MAYRKEDYVCLSAMLRAREPGMLSKEKATRLIDTEDFDSAAKMLAGLGFADMSDMSAGEIDAYLSERTGTILKEIENLCPDKNVVNIFRIKYDYHNAKTLTKSVSKQENADHVYSSCGRFGADELKSALTEGHSDLPEVLYKAINEANSTLARTGNPQLSDFELDRAYFAELKEAADKTGSDYVKGYVELLIDMTNLRTAVRSVRMGKDAEFMRTALIPGGKTATDKIAAEALNGTVSEAFAGTSLSAAAASGEEAAKGGKLTKFELACDNAVMEYLKGAKMVSYGIEPVLSYLAAVDTEQTAVRMVMSGKLTKVSSEVLKERLRDLYA